MPAAGHHDQKPPYPPLQQPSSGAEYHQTAVLVHNAWEGWYYVRASETDNTTEERNGCAVSEPRNAP